MGSLHRSAANSGSAECHTLHLLPGRGLGALIAPPLPSPSCRIAAVRAQGDPSPGQGGLCLGQGRAVSQQTHPVLRARHRDALSETFRCFASSLWPEADTHSPSSAARSRLRGSLGPVSPSEKEIQALLVAALPLPPPACSEFEKHLVRISSRLSSVPFSPPALGRHHCARQGGLVAGQCPVS